MDQIKIALEKAKLIDKEGNITKETKKGLRKRRKWKNRFGDFANFELWEEDMWPPDWANRCGFCGMSLGKTKIQVQPRNKLRFFSCRKCYEHGKRHQGLEGLK